MTSVGTSNFLSQIVRDPMWDKVGVVEQAAQQLLISHQS